MTVSGLGGGARGHQGSGAFRGIEISRFWGRQSSFCTTFMKGVLTVDFIGFEFF